MLNKKRGKGRPKKAETGIFSIRHDKKVLKKVRKRLTAKELQTIGKQWLDQLAEDQD